MNYYNPMVPQMPVPMVPAVPQPMQNGYPQQPFIGPLLPNPNQSRRPYNTRHNKNNKYSNANSDESRPKKKYTKGNLKINKGKKRGAVSPIKNQHKKSNFDPNAMVVANIGEDPKIPTCMLVGEYQPYMPKNENIKQFSDAFTKNIPNLKVLFKFGDSYNFQLDSLKDGHYCMFVAVKFGECWFDGLSDAITKAKKAGTLKHVDLFEETFKHVGVKLTEIKNYYKPVGPIFVVTKCGVMSDSVVGAYAIANGHPIIQLDENGKPKFDSCNKDPEKIAKHLAYKLTDKIKRYKVKLDSSMNEAVSITATIDPDELA